jgi:outer membrane protein assembly factor BamB
LLIVTEGDKHLAAVDLMSGETRWRSNIGTGAVRMKRVGRLLLVATGQSSLCALDVVSGAIVWRLRDRFRFRFAPTVDGEDCFVLAGGGGSPAALYCINVLSGAVRFRQALLERHVEGDVMVAGQHAIIVARDRSGAKFIAYNKESGQVAWTSTHAEAFSGSACIAVDDRIVVNTPTGNVLGIDAAHGGVVYRRALGPVSDTDTPKRLEPILRSGALFVPHPDVHVLRPDDGAVLARIEGAGAIPDLLRVDEACNVYVAEESGYLMGYGTSARLELVRS